MLLTGVIFKMKTLEIYVLDKPNCYANAKCSNTASGYICLCEPYWHYWAPNKGCLTGEKPLSQLWSKVKMGIVFLNEHNF